MSYKVYIIYHFDDENRVKEFVSNIEDELSKKTQEKIEWFRFNPNGTYYENKHIKKWKRLAKTKISEANLVCFFMKSYSEIGLSNYKNVFWEYKIAKKYNKKIIPIKYDEDSINEECLEAFFGESYSGAVNDFRSKNCEIVVDNAQWTVSNQLYGDSNNVDAEIKQKELYYNLLFEQYKIMIETSEKLMERRQSVSNLYTTVLTTIVSFVCAALALKNTWAISFIFLCAGVVAVLLTITWQLQLKSYAKNNYGKYEVINAIEAKLPANMFYTEYKFNVNMGIRSYSENEKYLPLVFRVFGMFFIIFGIVYPIIMHFI